MEIRYFWAIEERDSPFFTMWLVSAHTAGAARMKKTKMKRQENRLGRTPVRVIVVFFIQQGMAIFLNRPNYKKDH